MSDATQPVAHPEDIIFSDVPTTPSGDWPGKNFFSYDQNETKPEDYNSVSWPYVIGSGLSNFAPSATRAVVSLPETAYKVISDPVGTAKSAVNTIVGLGSKVATATGHPDPAIQPAEKYADPLLEPFTSVGGLKKTLAEDPVSILSLAAAPFTGGESASTKLGALTKDATALDKTAALTKTAAGFAANPADAVISTASGARKLFGNIINTVGSASSGISKPSLNAIYRASQMGDEGVPYSNEFKNVLSGATRDQDIADRMRKAAKDASHDASQAWVNDSKNVMAANAPVDYGPVVQAIQEQQKKLHSVPLPNGATNPMALNHPEANAALLEAIDQVKRVQQATGSGLTELEKANDLKQTLYDLSERQTTNDAKSAVKGVWSAVRGQLFKTAPEYAKLMDNYQGYLQGNTDMAKGLGLGKNTQSGTTIGKAIKGSDKPFQQQLLKTIYDKDPGLEYAIAGADVRNAIARSPSLRSRLVEMGMGAGTIGAASFGHPFIALGTAGTATANELLQWPGLNVAGNKMAGAGSRILGPPAGIVAKTARTALPVTANIKRAQEPEIEFTDEPPLSPDQIPTGQWTGGRVERKSGGRAKYNAIGSEVNRVRALLKDRTQHMLSVPDDAIATALQMAKSG